MNILFRVDAYAEIALGHISRCLILAANIMNDKREVVFVSYNDTEAESRLRTSGLPFKLIDYKVNESGKSLDEIEVISSMCLNVDVIVLDSYDVDNFYIKALRELAPIIIYLDDMGNDFDVDMVVNPSCKDASDYYSADIALLGVYYIILDKRHLVSQPKCCDYPKSIMITMGGVDHFNISSRILPLIEGVDKDIRVNMVIGPYYSNKDEIELAVSESHLNVTLFEGFSDISSIIKDSDVAVSAGGFTVYELAASSTPCIGISLWENQNNNIEALSYYKTLIPMYYSPSVEFDVQLFRELKLLINNKYSRNEMALSGISTIDGRGVNRISERIVEAYG